VLLAESGWTGLELFCEQHPDVIVLDLKMPGIGGLTVLEQIRRLEPHQRVIVLTGAGTPEKEAQVRALGVVDYLEKESSLLRVGESVKHVLDTDSTRR
jgi:CheY-like chemotaxis protein